MNTLQGDGSTGTPAQPPAQDNQDVTDHGIAHRDVTAVPLAEALTRGVPALYLWTNDCAHLGTGSPVCYAPRVPPLMGTARADQLQGSPYDQLIELAGRNCYDSLGARRSRNSSEYHQHIVEVGHLSVQEHAVLTAEVSVSDDFERAGVLASCVNRPGLWVESLNEYGRLRLSINLRAAREWWGLPGIGSPSLPLLNSVGEREIHDELGMRLILLFRSLAPLASVGAGWEGRAVSPLMPRTNIPISEAAASGPDSWQQPWAARTWGRLSVVPMAPITESEVNVTFWLGNVSRGLTHEQVRHRTAISQRSTRFVNEAESAYAPHPAMADDPDLCGVYAECLAACRKGYKLVEAAVKARLEQNPSSKPYAIKQARGAARGLLGNALETQMLATTSVRLWKWMVRKRCSAHADAEIRALYATILTQLKEHLPSFFVGSDWDLVPAPDGLGHVCRCAD